MPSLIEAKAKRLRDLLSRPNQPAQILVMKRTRVEKIWSQQNLYQWLRNHAEDGPYVSLVGILEKDQILVAYLQAFREEPPEDADSDEDEYAFRDFHYNLLVPLNEVDSFIATASRYCGKNCE